jgi:hypothetical protein
MLTPSDDKMHLAFSHQTKVDGVCKTRMDLLDRLAGAVERLGRAKLSLETDGQNADGREKHSVRDHADALRNECGTIRSQLEYHRVSHGC